MNLVFAQPVGCRLDDEGSALRRPAATPVVAYAAAAVAGGGAVGALLAGAGAAVGELHTGATFGIAIAALCAVAAILQARGRVRPLPQRHAQVPRRWTLWKSRSKLGMAFGAMLGAGAMTYLHYAAMYLLAAIALASQSAVIGALVGAAYGGVRGFVLALAWFGARSVERRERRLAAAAHAADAALTPFGIAVTAIVIGLQVAAW
jgi:hypothetical protein